MSASGRLPDGPSVPVSGLGGTQRRTRLQTLLPEADSTGGPVAAWGRGGSSGANHCTLSVSTVFFFPLLFRKCSWHMTLRSLCITLYSCLCAEMEVGAVESSVPAASCVRCPRDRGWWMFSTLWRLWGTANLTWWTLRWASLERRKSENRAGFMIGGKFFLLNAEDVTGNENETQEE